MQLIQTSASFIRPADTNAYTANDLIANSTTAGSVVPMIFTLPYGGALKLWRASVAFNSSTVTNAKFLLHLYNSSPTPTNGDNAAWLTTSSGWLTSVAVDGTTNTFSDSTVAYSAAFTSPTIILASGNTRAVYGLLTATAAYTPTSAEVFTVTLVGEAYV